MYPCTLSLIRHAESAGNVANAAAIQQRRHELDLALRDMDVPLSPLGETQARELADWFRRAERPDAVICSPYARAVQTATIALACAGLECDVVLDERLREREFGILDRLTKFGIEARYPEQAAARAFLGKFFHRPPGGESWADVAARVRGFVTDLRLDYAQRRVVVVTHQAVIMLFRYVLDGLDETELLALDRAEEIVNTGVTTYAGDGHTMRLVAFNDADHLSPAETTAQPDRSVAPR
ncbi:MAG TPA: histidine phosphatase family protein [Acidimicrobiales bacterium]|nr:histidine phosphatase family protein [Acidimicrobiales bacterium]